MEGVNFNQFMDSLKENIKHWVMVITNSTDFGDSLLKKLYGWLDRYVRKNFREFCPASYLESTPDGLQRAHNPNAMTEEG